jgi:VWFA-related protein
MRPTSHFSKDIMRALFIAWTIWFGWTINAESQSHAPASPAEKKEEFKIRIGVEEVRLDAVVLHKGRQVADLTADDFEIYQDGRPQRITSCTYIRENHIQPGIGAAQLKTTGVVPQPSSPRLTQEAVKRTIVFLVDDLSMTFTGVYRLRYGLRKYVENQMQPGDLVAILRTNAGESAHQTFTMDKRQLLEMIDNIRWGFSVQGTLPQHMAIGYCINALRSMPGRKYLMLVTLQTTSSENSQTFNRLADAALRAGVVVHTLDMLPLFTLWPEILPSGESSSESEVMAARNVQNDLPLSKKTGGLFLTNVNWFLDGLGDVNEEIKGYYLLTYVPSSDTFKLDSRSVYHQLDIKVMRQGCEVHHRDGFFGTAQTPDATIKHSNPLLEAMLSPFQHTDLAVNLFSGFINDPKKGYLIQAWIHLNGEQLSIIEEKGKDPFISLDGSAVTTDIFGAVRDSGNNSYKIPIKNKEQIPWIREHGLGFFIEIPAKKPGSYYVRVAVQDKGSGKLGSAYQYVEIPDLKNGHLALSNIFVTNHDTDADSNLHPSEEHASIRAALGTYSPGECIHYAAVIYNAKYGQEKPPDLESNVVLYREGAEIFRSKAEKVAMSGVNDLKRIPLRGELFLDAMTKPGDYVLQLQIWDKQVNGNQNRASQTLSFEVPASPENDQHN